MSAPWFTRLGEKMEEGRAKFETWMKSKSFHEHYIRYVADIFNTICHLWYLIFCHPDKECFTKHKPSN